MLRQLRHVAVEVAEREARLGVRERGGPNRGPRVDMYQKADNLPGVGYAWCASFVQWCFKAAGRALPYRTASVGFLVDYARRNGWLVTRPLRGDLVCFHWDNNNYWADHIGFVRRVLSLGPVGFLLLTVEGNTSSDDAGSQDDGDGVFLRRRFVRRDRVNFIRVPGEVEYTSPQERRKRSLRSWILARRKEGWGWKRIFSTEQWKEFRRLGGK